MYFVTSVKISTMMMEVSSEQSRSQLYMHAYRVQLPLLLLLLLCVIYAAVVAAAAVLLLPAAVRHRVSDGQM